jgi:rhamnogalacturonyl hydrolase YesR
MAGYKLMMAALLKYQGADGMWRQLIDHDEAWPEILSSGHVHLRADHRRQERLARRRHLRPRRAPGWIAVTGYIDQNNDVTQVCEGTNKPTASNIISSASANRRLPRPGTRASAYLRSNSFFSLSAPRSHCGTRRSARTSAPPN